MPKIKIDHRDLEKLVGRKLPLKELEEICPNIKCEWEGEKDGSIELEATHDRPDLLSTEGIARAVRYYLGVQKIQEFKFKKSGLHCKVEKNVLSVRPHSRMFIVKNVTLSDELIEQLMQLQEKIHLSYTTGRKNASIGVYDLDSFEFPITYCIREQINFTPLGEQEPMSAQEVLEKTEKGKEYAHLVTPGKYPLILDRKNLVLSMPPILNSEDTKLTPRTHNLFVDVSGENELLVEKIAVLMAVALSERGTVETVTMEYPDKKIESPGLKKESIEAKIGYMNEKLGLQLKPAEAVKLLKKSGFEAKESKGTIKAAIPCYRFDLMHPIDLAEEVAMAYGYNQMEPLTPKVYTEGKLNPIEEYSNKAGALIVGAGYQEVLTYMLTSGELLETMSEDFIRISNPVSDEHNAIRNTLIPGLLELVSKNKHYPLPHKVFEAGDTVETGNKPEMKRKLAVLAVDTNVTFTTAKSLLDALSKNLGFSYSLKEENSKAFIPGRAGSVYSGNKKIGVLGEIHPDILNKLEIEHPAVTLEVNLEGIK